jgi:hypothetical protein
MKTRLNCWSYKDCSYSGLKTTHIIQTTTCNIELHRLLQEIYQRIHAYYNTNGKIIEKRHEVPVECRLSEKSRHIETKVGNYVDINFPRLEQGLSDEGYIDHPITFARRKI